MMQIVIDIPKDSYKATCNGCMLPPDVENVVNAIRQGILLSIDILDKIRNEILEEKECAYADFEQYKVEYLGQDWEDVCDSLPQDDFRYGMERCIEIIDRYKAERNDKE